MSASQYGHLSVVFQPIYKINKDYGQHEEFGVECLIRGPGAFQNPLLMFDLAKSYGNLKKLDIACCLKCAESASRYYSDGMVFINMRACTITHIEIADKLLNYIPADRLVIELSEQDAVGNMAHLCQAVLEWKKRGVKLAIDDFASGYDRITALVEIKPAFIKLDGALIQNCDSDKTRQVVIKHLTKMTEELNIHTIAEMIETEKEYETVRRLGITIGQGFLLGKPEAVEKNELKEMEAR